MTHRRRPSLRIALSIPLIVLAGCGGRSGETGPAPEPYDLKEMEAMGPAGGPESPLAKEEAAKKKAAEDAAQEN